MKELQLIKRLEKKLIKYSDAEVFKFIAFEILNDLELIKKELRSNQSKLIEWKCSVCGNVFKSKVPHSTCSLCRMKG